MCEAGSQQRISCIIYSEFDNDAGPRLVCQAPRGFLSAAAFDSLADYVICKPELCGRHLVVVSTILDVATGAVATAAAAGIDADTPAAQAQQTALAASPLHERKKTCFTVVGFPTTIHNSKYSRNAFIFNLAFVFAREVPSEVAGCGAATLCKPHLHSRHCETAVKQLNAALRHLEEEFGFLSKTSKASLEEELGKMLDALNDFGTYNLQLVPTFSVPIEVGAENDERQLPPDANDFKVPTRVSTHPITVPANTPYTGVMAKLIRHVDGNNHLRRIAEIAGVDLAVARECFRMLAADDCKQLFMLDMFQWSDVYSVTPRIQELFTDPKLQEECIKYIAASKDNPPSFRDVFSLYAKMKHGVTPQMMNIDPGVDTPSLVEFGMLHGLIRKLPESSMLHDVYCCTVPAVTPSIFTEPNWVPCYFV
eukprot:TRINITY_DN2938_c0_g2_i1.p1 TRINITY_DN2938_c0_g2~~TRINITY_DN2938_c0_g2_i1.p1  ORF type:complete len:423 (-),score=118.84 TRINITY_DN2938_c0_g2_i1:59-1327(-)